jgi:formylglycine-generating enzyme required for sulfatase activity
MMKPNDKKIADKNMQTRTPFFCLTFFCLITSQHAAEHITNSLGMKLMPIQPGTFTMGQEGPPMEDYLRQKRFGEMHKDIDRIDFDEKPAHQVTITQPFHIGVTEVTVAQFRQFDPEFKKNDPKSKPADDDAASGGTWDKAVAFCEWLSKKEGKTYRLPTEAEWEYACRAGTATLFHTGDTLPDAHQKWFGEDNFRGVYFPPGPMPREYDERNVGKPAASLKQGQIIGLDHPVEESKAGGTGSLRVAQKTPNAWGLHDMHGNLAEWCSDWYGPYESGAQTDPLGRMDGDCRVFRGGFHSSMIRFLRSANRGSWVTKSASERIGFRVVQGELPKGKLMPVATLPLNAQNVSQRDADTPVRNKTTDKSARVTADAPFFEGPKPFVRIPDGAVGPVFISQNHSPSITECPNGDLLAVWFSTLGETDLTTANAASRLRFGAKEWEPASPFWDAQDVNDHAPKVWWDGEKTIFHIVEGRQHGDIVIRRSTDNGVTWSKAEVMRAHGESASNPIRTKEGVIAIPFDSAGLSISRDNGKTWSETGRHRRGSEDIQPGGKGPFMAGIHGPVVELAGGRLMAFGRISAGIADQERFKFKMPVSYSGDLGETWQWETSEFPVVSNTQRPAILRLKEGPILLCSFTDEARTPFKERKGLIFKSTAGDYTGTGLFTAVSYDEGKTWPDRRLIAPEGKTTADINGYLALTQTRDGNIQLITSKDHYAFNLAWLKQLPPAPKK